MDFTGSNESGSAVGWGVFSVLVIAGVYGLARAAVAMPGTTVGRRIITAGGGILLLGGAIVSAWDILGR